MTSRSKTTTSPSNTGWGEFEDAGSSNGYNIIASSQGPGGSGKTHFWLTAPEPIAYFLFDPGGLKGLRENELFKHKDIKVLDLSKRLDYGRTPKEERVKKAEDTVKMFDDAWDIALKKARTIVIDKEDKLWETVRYAYDEVFSPTPKNFYELNAQYQGMFVQAEAAGVNFGLIRGLKEVWGKTGVNQNTGRPTMGFTGEVTARGQKEVVELVQINLSHRWDDDDREFKVKIMEKCRLGNAVELIGQEFGNLDFPMLGVTLYPEVDPAVWS